MARSGFECKYVGESLTSLVTEQTLEATAAACRSIAEEARSTLHTAAVAATPSRTGVVRDSWLALPIWPHGPDRWGATVRNDHWLAHLLNYGTEAHEIRPKGPAKGGKRALREGVGPRAGAHVRGLTAAHMAERAVDVVSHTIADTSYPAQRRWAADVEMAIQRTKRTHLK